LEALLGLVLISIQGDVTVRVEGFGDGNHRVADVVMLLAVVCLAIATWSCLGDGASVPPWKAFAGVALAGLLALASLTRHPHWAISMRFLTAAWIIAAPYLLNFAHVASAFRAYMAIGALLMATASIPRASRLRSDFALPAGSHILNRTRTPTSAHALLR
jgi:hypothetical protein